MGGAVQGHLVRLEVQGLLPCTTAGRSVGRTNVVAQWSAARGFRHISTCWRAWNSWAAVLEVRSRCAGVLCWICQVVDAWFSFAKKRSGSQRLASLMARLQRPWLSEVEWQDRACGDPVLAVMFQRFALALNQQRLQAPWAGRIALDVQDGALEALASLIWTRQQISVALGRLKGYPQPWVLGAWPAGQFLLLSPENPYYLQAEMRLSIMVSELDAQQSPDRVASIFELLCADSGDRSGDAIGEADSPNSQTRDLEPSHWQRMRMWHALADLLVVHHPGWSSRPQSSSNEHSGWHRHQQFLCTMERPAEPAITMTPPVAAVPAPNIDGGSAGGSRVSGDNCGRLAWSSPPKTSVVMTPTTSSFIDRSHHGLVSRKVSETRTPTAFGHRGLVMAS